ncbi:Com family DNA-binding transcriptional regulator [bacterium]|nr:Com family DNA-binding transcriptional regulator [bacterium]
MKNDLKEYRCSNCNKLLFKGSIEEGLIEIKCRGCKNINTIQIDKELEEDTDENIEILQ